MDAGIVIPVVAIVFGIACGGLSIWTEHKKDMALIEKGLYQPKQPSAHPGWGFLLAGSIVTGIGIALTISAFVFQIGETFGIPSKWFGLGGLTFLFIGIALIVVYSITKEKKVIPKTKVKGEYLAKS